jgi:hypothetical protein
VPAPAADQEVIGEAPDHEIDRDREEEPREANTFAQRTTVKRLTTGGIFTACFITIGISTYDSRLWITR